MRLLSWNVRSLRDSRQDVVAVIRRARPDVVCLQESPRLLPGWRAGRLARDCGLVVATAGRPVAALAILSAPGVRVVASIREPLPWTPWLHRRGLARAVVELDGRTIQVATLHLGLRLEERRAHARLVTERLRRARLPAVVAGDINETDSFPAWRILGAAMQDAWTVAGSGDGRTFSTARPRRRIDAVFVDPRLAVHRCEVLAGEEVVRGSDHRPVLVDLGWTDLSD